MTEKKKLLPALKGKQKKYLRALGHHLDQSVLVGKDGLSDNVLQSCDDNLQAHELIKVKLGQNCPLGKKEAAEMVAGQTGSHLVQLIGRTIILYRPNPDLPPDKAIRLPR
jgi:RNA-binding protein